MKINLLTLLICGLFACNPTDTPKGREQVTATPPTNVSGYDLQAVPGTNWQSAVKKNASGKVIEMGFLENGRRVGTWALYEHATTRLPSQISHYENGKLTGIQMQLNEGGQTRSIANYQNDLLHGYWGTYQFGRVVEEAEYQNGQLHGVYNVYTLATGKLQSSAEFKNGVQDGFYRTYHPEGRMTSEYLYKNGEKVSGGAK